MERIQQAREQAEKLLARFIGTAEGRRTKQEYLSAKAEYVNCLKNNFISSYFEKDSETSIAKVCVGEKSKMDYLGHLIFEKKI